MKKLFSIVVMMAVACCSYAEGFSAVSPSGHTLYYTIMSSGTVWVTDYEGYRLEGDLIIPDSVSDGTTTYLVTGIGDYVFRLCVDMTSVTLPNTLVSIDAGAFYYCSGLTSITIPRRVATIAEDAFGLCDGVTTVVFNADSCVWVYYPFSDFSNVDSFVIGENVKVIPGSLCAGMSGSFSLTIPDSVVTIGNRAFQSCSALTSVVIGKSVTAVGDEAFRYSGVESVTIGRSVESFGLSPFANCDHLTTIVVDTGNTVFDSRDNCNAVIRTADNQLIMGCGGTTFPTTVADIGAWAFNCCHNLTTLTIPRHIKRIRNNAFYYCSNLDSIAFNADSCIVAGEMGTIGAFVNCNNIKSVSFGESVKNIPVRVCSGIGSLKTVYMHDSVESIGALAFYKCGSLDSVAFPGSLTFIGDSAFMGCGMTSITIPRRLNQIRYRSFAQCDKIKTIRWNADSCSVKDIPFSENVTSFIIGENVKVIPANLCEGLRISSIVVPDSVHTIGDDAFAYSRLKDVSLGRGLQRIGKRAFGTGYLKRVKAFAPNPPIIDATTFSPDDNGCEILVPCSYAPAYESAPYWSSLNVTGSKMHELWAITTDPSRGRVDTLFLPRCEDDIAGVRAIAKPRYMFERWSDGDTSNPRYIKVQEDTYIEALFVEEKIKIGVWSADGRIIVRPASDCALTIYDIMGRVVIGTQWIDGKREIPLPPGVYIVKIDGRPIQKVEVYPFGS